MDNLRKFKDFINEEVGVKNIAKIAKNYTKCEIFFHKDLDGILSLLSMRFFLKTYYNIEMVDAHQIQYGGLEYAVTQVKPGNLAVLVDFAHSRPTYIIATDHHDSQVGAGEKSSNYFKAARSNAETISGEISYNDIFTSTDIDLVKTVDSADFLANNITPDDIQNSLFSYNKELSPTKNRYMMGFVVNRLLLAYKNKRITVKSLDGKREHKNKNLLECMALDCNPSLYSMFNNLRHYIKNAKVSDKAGVLASPEELKKNLYDYIERMKNYKFVEQEDGEALEFDPSNWKQKKILSDGGRVTKGSHYDKEYKIISQYGGGTMFKPGSYDRYVPFKNYPEANFICLLWPMGLVQVSCNPFIEKALKMINLGEIAKEVLANHKKLLEKIYVSVEDLKIEFETSQDWVKMKKEEGEDHKGVGFKWDDLNAFYKDSVYKSDDMSTITDINNPKLKETINKTYENLNNDEKNFLKNYKISVWDLILKNSGGHPSITNVQGFGFLKYNKEALEIAYGTKKYTDMMKTFAREFTNKLKEKIDLSLSGKKIDYNSGIEFSGQNTNENFEYYLINTSGKEIKVDKNTFVNAGVYTSMSSDMIKVDNIHKKIIAKFDKFS